MDLEDAEEIGLATCAELASLGFLGRFDDIEPAVERIDQLFLSQAAERCRSTLAPFKFVLDMVMDRTDEEAIRELTRMSSSSSVFVKINTYWGLISTLRHSDLEKAHRLATEAIALADHAGLGWWSAGFRGSAASISVSLDRFDDALVHGRDGLERFSRRDDQSQLNYILDVAIIVLHRLDDDAAVRDLLPQVPTFLLGSNHQARIDELRKHYDAPPAPPGSRITSETVMRALTALDRHLSAATPGRAPT